MLRLTILAAALALTGCHREPAPVAPSSELPPLPPASGTAIGYLLDNASHLELTPEQYRELEKLDASLSVSNDSIDTQLREIEKPQEMPEPGKGEPPPKVNMAPGAMPMKTTPAAQKLHEARAENNARALEQAFAVLDPAQQEKATKILAERGITAPKQASQPAPQPAPEEAP
jgi:hypothetical protein